MKLLNFLFPTEKIDLNILLENRIISKRTFEENIQVKNKYKNCFLLFLLSSFFSLFTIIPLYSASVKTSILLLYVLPYVLITIAGCVSNIFVKNPITPILYALLSMSMFVFLIGFMLMFKPTEMGESRVYCAFLILLLLLFFIVFILYRANYKKKFKQSSYKYIKNFINSLFSEKGEAGENALGKSSKNSIFIIFFSYFLGMELLSIFSHNILASLILIIALFLTYPISALLCNARYFSEALQTIKETGNFSNSG